MIIAMIRILCAAFAAFLFYIMPASVYGQAEKSVFYADSAIQIPWPENIKRLPCSAELQAKVGQTCVQVGTQDASLGVVFLTQNAGYALGSEQALTAHLESSEGALVGIPNVHVMQSRVLKIEPLLGLMEILRKDGGLAGIPALAQPPVRQTAFLIPTGDKLAQVFIYLPLEGEEASRIYQALIENMTAGIVVHESPHLPAIKPNHQEGTLQILPKALAIGAIIALIGIFIIRFRRRKTD